MQTFGIILTLLIFFIVPTATIIYLVKRFHTTWQAVLVGAFALVGAQFLQQFALGGLNDLLASQNVDLLSTASGILLAATLVGLVVAFVDVAVRYLAYKFLKASADSLGFAAVFGASHAATDIIVFIAIPMLINFFSISYVAANGAGVLDLPAEEAARVSQQITDFLAIPWDSFVSSGLDRVLALIFSIAISVMVWLSFRQKKFMLAVAALVWFACYQAVQTVAYYAGITNWGMVLISAFFAAVNLWFLYKVYRNTPGAPTLFRGRLAPIEPAEAVE